MLCYIVLFCDLFIQMLVNSSFLRLLYSTNFFLVQFSEGSSVWLQFPVAGLQVPLSDLSFKLVIEFFA